MTEETLEKETTFNIEPLNDFFNFCMNNYCIPIDRLELEELRMKIEDALELK